MNNNDYFKKFAHQIMIDLSDEEMQSLEKDFEVMKKQLDALDEINTDNIEPMVFPFEVETSYLREDEVDVVLSKEDVLKNAPESREGQIVVPKVVG